MNIEKNIIDSIKDFPSKKICIVGMMPKEFYEIITINLIT